MTKLMYYLYCFVCVVGTAVIFVVAGDHLSLWSPPVFVTLSPVPELGVVSLGLGVGIATFAWFLLRGGPPR